MSTLPHDPSAAVAEHKSPVISAARYQHNFDKAVHDFEIAAEELLIERPSAAELRDLCGQVAAICDHLFPGELAVEVRRDAEIPDDLYFVFSVGATGDVDEIMARNNEWQLRVRRSIGGRADLFCLSFDVR